MPQNTVCLGALTYVGEESKHGGEALTKNSALAERCVVALTYDLCPVRCVDALTYENVPACLFKPAQATERGCAPW